MPQYVLRPSNGEPDDAKAMQDLDDFKALLPVILPHRKSL